MLVLLMFVVIEVTVTVAGGLSPGGGPMSIGPGPKGSVSGESVGCGDAAGAATVSAGSAACSGATAGTVSPPALLLLSWSSCH